MELARTRDLRTLGPSPKSPFPPKAAERVVRRALAGLVLGGLCLPATGQVYFNDRNPFSVPVPPMPEQAQVPNRAGDEFAANENIPYRPRSFDGGGYNIKMGPVYATFGASVGMSYTDNALLTDTAGADTDNLTINPMANMSLRWQMTDQARLQLGIGIGYQFSLLQDQLNFLTISPNTSVDYAFSVGDVLITVFDRISTAADAGQRNDIYGTGNASGVRFNRFNNAIGTSAEWSPYTDTSVSGGYTFSLDKGIDDSYSQLDGYSHMLSAAAFQRLGPLWTVGLSGGASVNDFSEEFQNSSRSIGVGPVVTWRPTQFLNFSGSVRYTVVNAEGGGQTGDTSDFSGLTGNLSIAHRINRYLSHTLSGGLNPDIAAGANYALNFTLAYGLTWQATERLPLNLSVNYTASEQSGGLNIFAPPPGSVLATDPRTGELILFTPDGRVFRDVVLAPDGLVGVPYAGQRSDSWWVTLSTGLQLSQKLSSGLSLSYQTRSSDFAYGSFGAFTVSLTFNYQF